MRRTARPTAQEVENLLAQTQCTECGYDGCAPYAKAMVEGGAPINKCAPGGQSVIALLAQALNMPEKAQIPPEKPNFTPTVAYITEADCIGCTLCIQKCPTDAILGAAKQSHTVIAPDCTGCNLCVPICPTACIALVKDDATPHSPARAKAVKTLVEAKKQRQYAQLLGGQTPPPATLSGGIKDAPPNEQKKLSLEIPPELQAKMAKARAGATQKWTQKKVPTPPKLLQKRKMQKKAPPK